MEEVQRAPRLLDVVHRLIESADKRFAVTGSSTRKLRRGASNLRVSRAFVYNLYPLTAPELQDAFELDDTLRWGTLPRLDAISLSLASIGLLPYLWACSWDSVGNRCGSSFGLRTAYPLDTRPLRRIVQ